MCDVVGFTTYSDQHDPEEVVANLTELTEAFETLTETHHLEKINAAGDAFVAAKGLNGEDSNPVLDCVKCGIDMISYSGYVPAGWQVRVGIHYGPVVAGVVGRKKFLYGLWGDTVNVASRTHSNGIISAVNCTKVAWDMVASHCVGESRGMIEIKGKGPMEMFVIKGLL